MRVRLKLDDEANVVRELGYLASYDWVMQNIGKEIDVVYNGQFWYRVVGKENLIVHKNNFEEVVVDLRAVVMRNLGDYVLKNITGTEELFVVLLTYFAEAAAQCCLNMCRDGELECEGRYYPITVDLVMDMFTDELCGFDQRMLVDIDAKYGICSRFKVDTGMVLPSKVVVE